MALRSKLTLLNLSAQSATQTGEWFYLPRPTAKRFAIRQVATKKAGTNPTQDGKVQYSLDGGTHAKDLAPFTQVTTGTDSEELVHIPEEEMVPGMHFRAVSTLGGTTPSYDVLIELWYD